MRIKRVSTQAIYNVIEGANFSLSYNEDLSKGKIVLREKEYIDFIPYEEVKVLDLDFAPGYYYFCIANVNIKEARNRTGDKIYTYEIDLMSQTKLLENYLLPSLSITPKTNGGKTIYDYLERYNDLFGPKIRQEKYPGPIELYAPKYHFSSRCKSKFHNFLITDNNKCPELQFNAPTLRECLTLLMQVKDCIPVLNNNEIDFIDLSEKQRQQDINDEHISYVMGSRSAEDYVSDIKTELKNVIQDEEYIECVENINFRNNEGNLVNSETMALYTQHPIYDIVKFEISFCYYDYHKYGSSEGGGSYYKTVDITSAICEYKEWILKKINTQPDDVIGHPENLHKYRNTCVYYTRGNNKIDNFAQITKVGFFQIAKNCLQFIENAVCDLHPTADAHNGFFLPVEQDVDIWKKAVAFKIKYKTKANVVAKLSKSQKQPIHREVLDNQSNNYVNAYTQGILEYAKANRLGNQTKIVHARYPRNYDMPLVGDYFNKNDIIYKADYQINANSVDATFYACTNYVLRNYFTGVNSKLRAWKIVDSSEAFYREEHKKYYLEFSYNKFYDILGADFQNEGNEFMRHALGSIDNLKLEFASIFVNTIGENYVMETVRNVIGNSVEFTFGFEDNRTFAMYISDLNGVGGSLEDMYSYTDNDGNYQYLSVYLVKSFKLYNNPIFDDISYEARDIQESDVDIFLSKLREIPKMNYGDYTLFAKIDLRHEKDNKEIIKQNLQFEYCAEEGIYLGDEFMKGQINNIHEHLKLRISNTAPDGNRLPEGTDYEQYWFVDPSEEAINHESTILLKVQDSVEISDNQYAYIYNSKNNNILLAWKGRNIYLNMLIDRDKNVYKHNEDGEWVVKN